MADATESKAQDRMERVVADMGSALAGIRTGRASVALLDGIQVDYYGTMVPLNQTATLSAQEARLLVIQPWEPRMVPIIEKAVMASDLGLTPTSDGQVIRLPIPPLTEERRKELVRHVRRIAEEHRVAVRNIRRDANDGLKSVQRSGEVSEDDAQRGQKAIQELTDRFIAELDEHLVRKEEEIMQI